MWSVITENKSLSTLLHTVRKVNFENFQENYKNNIYIVIYVLLFLLIVNIHNYTENKMKSKCLFSYFKTTSSYEKPWTM